jgi:hypothetical protein
MSRSTWRGCGPVRKSAHGSTSSHHRFPSPGVGLAPLSEVHLEAPSEAGTSDRKRWDVFISHANEDKSDIPRPLFAELTRFEVTVWFDEAELRIGDSLRRNIDEGLARSAFGVVVFSTAFFPKGWTQYELGGIVTRTVAGDQNLLPIWHKVTKDEERAQSPSLADTVARSTSEFTAHEIASEIAQRVRPDLFLDPSSPPEYPPSSMSLVLAPGGMCVNPLCSKPASTCRRLRRVHAFRFARPLSRGGGSAVERCGSRTSSEIYLSVYLRNVARRSETTAPNAADGIPG